MQKKMKKGMIVWVIKVLSGGEIYPREIDNIMVERGVEKIFLSRFDHDWYSREELTADEGQALLLAMKALEKKKTAIEDRIDSLRMRFVEINKNNPATDSQKVAAA